MSLQHFTLVDMAEPPRSDFMNFRFSNAVNEASRSRPHPFPRMLIGIFLNCIDHHLKLRQRKKHYEMYFISICICKSDNSCAGPGLKLSILEPTYRGN